MNTLTAPLISALKARFKTPKEAMDALGLDSSLLSRSSPEDKGMGYLSQKSATAIAQALKAQNKLAMDADIGMVADLLRQIEGLEGDRRQEEEDARLRARDLETSPNAGVPPWLVEEPDDEEDFFDTWEESEEDSAYDRKARDAKRQLGRDETEEEAEKREEEEEREADDALREEEDARREAEDASKDTEDRRKAEDRMRKASDRLRKMGADARRRAEDRSRMIKDQMRARDEGLEPPDLYKPDTANAIEQDRKRAKDRRRMGRDYRKARDVHRRARDAWRRHSEDWQRAHDARKDAEDRRREAEDAKREDDARRASDMCREADDRMRRASEDGKRAKDLLHRARDARLRARDARRRHASDQPPDFKDMPKPGGEMVTKSAMDEAIRNALKDSDYRHRSIMDAIEAVRPKVGKIALDSSIQNESDVYARALDALGVNHAGITQLGALKQIFSMAQKPGSEPRSNGGFAFDTAPRATDFQKFKQMFGEHVARIERA